MASNYEDYTTIMKTFTLKPFTNMTNITNAMHPFCYKLLYMTFQPSNIRLWDILILVPNAIFFLYLLVKMCTIVFKLIRYNRPVLTALFVLVLCSHLISILRCVISMSVHTSIYGVTDRILWLFLKFFLTAAELSVVTFGFFFGHLDSRKSIKRVLLVTFFISLIYSNTQGVLEFLVKNESFPNIQEGEIYYTLFGHGGMIFLCVSSATLFTIYCTICILPLTCLKNYFVFPVKKSFYIYCLILAIMNLAQTIGSLLLYKNILYAMCIVDFTSYLYFIGFPPLVYFIFLYRFFNLTRSNKLLFTYQSILDEDPHLAPDQPTINSSEYLPHNFYSPEISGIYSDASQNENSTGNDYSSSLGVYQNWLSHSISLQPDLTDNESRNVFNPGANNEQNKNNFYNNKNKQFPTV